jgi:hypothetical protein
MIHSLVISKAVLWIRIWIHPSLQIQKPKKNKTDPQIGKVAEIKWYKKLVVLLKTAKGKFQEDLRKGSVKFYEYRKIELIYFCFWL